MGMTGRLLAFLVVFAGFSVPAMAYLDPGTGSLILQTLIGGIAAAVLFGKTAWYKVKTFFSGKQEPDNQSDESTRGSDE